MKKLLITVLMLLTHVCVAQVNLVPNPSFEDTVSCPNAGNQVDRAVGWYPSRNTPDYFNACDWINGFHGVPNNTVGYQYAHTGDAYCGMVSYMHIYPNAREHFTCALLSQLSIGKKYVLSFYTSWSGKHRIACNKLGMLLSTYNYSTTNINPLNNYAQLFTDSIIIDSVNWVYVTGNFIADSNYSFLTIGNFFDSSMVDTIRPLPSSIAYYYIDDVSVTEDTTTSIFDLNNSISLKIYPNPVTDILFIESANISVSSIELFDATNKLVLKSAFEFKARSKLNLYELNSGIYFLKVNFKNNSSSFHKLIKL